MFKSYDYKMNDEKYYLQTVVVRILRHSSVNESPCKIIHGVLLVLNSLCHDLSIEVVM